jgi:PTS system ascorbate-specific IIA component
MTFQLPEMLPKNRIRCKVYAEGWREVVQKTGAVMAGADLVEPVYIEAMIRLIEDSGPYLVIAPGVALLHARPEDGVKKAGMALLTLSEPVEFGHSSNDPVWIAFGLAATTDTSHIDAMAELATWLSQPGAIDALKQSESPDEISEMIRKH